MGYSRASGLYAHKRQGKTPKRTGPETGKRKRGAASPDSHRVRMAQAAVVQATTAATLGVFLGVVAFIVCRAT